MAKLTIDKLGDIKGKRVFCRVDFNVPMDKNLNITDDTRIVEALPTIRFLLEKGARLILASHLGRPKGREPEFSLKPVAKYLSRLLGKEVKMAPDCIGPEVEKMVNELQPGEVLLLENVRFYKEEEKNNPEFAQKLAALCDIYVNDAFGTAHRAHATTEGMTRFVKTAAAGFLMKKEIEYLGKVLTSPDRPFVALIGGAKVGDKIAVLNNLMKLVDVLLIGGGMSYTFLKAQGLEIGKSLLDTESIDLAKKIMEEASKKTGLKFLLPVDCLVADKDDESANTKIVPVSQIPADWQGMDIGEQTFELFARELKQARTILWNGPVGKFEVDTFSNGTQKIAELLASLKATTVIGGGDTAAAVQKFGVKDKMTHVSTGGGASLEFLEGRTLPGIAALNDMD